MPITPLPTPPSRQDPVNFSARGDLFMAALPVFVDEANALQTNVNQSKDLSESAASTAVTKASEAAAARDIVMAAVNFKGEWSSLSGPLNIPASVLHNGAVWMLSQNVATVQSVTPGVSAVWLNVTPASGLGSAAYQSSSAFQAAFGALAGLVKANGSGGVSAATAADIVALIGSSFVANAGHATAAGTASVLAGFGLEAFSGDVNTLLTPGMYGISSPSTNLPAEVPSQYGHLLVMRRPDTYTQIYCEYSTGRMWMRSALTSNFPAWRSVIDSGTIGSGLAWDGSHLNCTVDASYSRGFALITATQGWTVPAGVKSVFATVIAPGGGGSGSNGGVGSRGGRGGAVKALVTGLVSGTSIACTVGSIGTGGAPNANGLSGGTTSFGALVTCTGGVGGSHNGNGAAANGSFSLGAGVADLANALTLFAAAGSAAAYAKLNNSDFINTASNAGGVTGGGTYTGSYDGYNGSAGAGYGSGGGAGSSPSWSASGASGGAGVILLEW